MASHSSTFAWKIPWTEEPGRLQSMGSRRVGHNWATSLSLFTFMHWRRKWKPTPMFLPGESHGQRSLAGYSPWDQTWLTNIFIYTTAQSLVRPHRRQPTRLPHPWGSPGKNTGVGCHSLLQRIFPIQGLKLGLLYCRQILYCLSHQGSPWCTLLLLLLSHFSRVQLCDPIDGSLPGSPVPGILQARILQWLTISFSTLTRSGS